LKYFTLITIIFISYLSASKVEITSESFYTNENENRVYFVDDVKVKKDKDRLSSNLLIVFFNDNNETKSYKATGDVKFNIYKNEIHYEGSAKSVEYIVKKSEYIFIGDAIIHDLTTNRDIFGDEIILNSKSGKATVKSLSKKPSKFIFEMED